MRSYWKHVKEPNGNFVGTQWEQQTFSTLTFLQKKKKLGLLLHICVFYHVWPKLMASVKLWVNIITKSKIKNIFN